MGKWADRLVVDFFHLIYLAFCRSFLYINLEVIYS